MTALVVVEGVVILVLALLVAGLLRSHADILRALNRLGVDMEDDHDHPDFRVREGVAPPGTTTATEAHDISGRTLEGGAVAMRLRGGEHTTLLAFLSSSCASCQILWGTMATQAPRHLRVVAVTRGPEEESVTALRDLAPAGFTVVMSSQAWADYGVTGTPYFALVDGTRGVVGEGSAGTWGRITKLLTDATGDVTEHGHDGAGREARADAELEAAGIMPGDPSLYPDPEDEDR